MDLVLVKHGTASQGSLETIELAAPSGIRLNIPRSIKGDPRIKLATRVGKLTGLLTGHSHPLAKGDTSTTLV